MSVESRASVAEADRHRCGTTVASVQIDLAALLRRVCLDANGSEQTRRSVLRQRNCLDAYNARPRCLHASDVEQSEQWCPRQSDTARAWCPSAFACVQVSARRLSDVVCINARHMSQPVEPPLHSKALRRPKI